MEAGKAYKLTFSTDDSELIFEINEKKELWVENRYDGISCNYMFTPDDIAILVAYITQHFLFQFDLNIKPSKN